MKTVCCLGVIVFLAAGAVSDGLAIINGSIETDHAAVGFLTDGAEATASAVLIDPYWVLTSASFAGSVNEGWFHVGLDHTAPDAVHAVSAFFPHPSYDPYTGDHNIALLRLATPVTGVAPLPWLTNPSLLYEGTSVTYVGYGQTSALDDSNTLRRSCTNGVEMVFAWTFVTYYDGAGPYLGDQGGPALLDVGGEPTVAGLVSLSVEGGLDYTVSTRVSSYLAFIDGVIAGNPPPVGVADEMPAKRVLRAAPNPFNPMTEISFELEGPEICRLAVFDARGRKVAELADGGFGAGRNVVRWDGRGADGRELVSGVYFVRLVVGGDGETEKVVLVR